MIQVSKSENFLAKIAVMAIAVASATACVAECGGDHPKPATETTEKPEATAE